jgi:hypothetical protein
MDSETIDAITKAIIALTSLITAIGIVWNLVVSKKTHTLVNSAHDDSVVRVEQLTQGLIDAGATVPTDPNIATAQANIASRKD